MLLQDLQKANIQAMKDHDQNARAILSVVISRCKLLEVELRSKGNELTDADVLGIIQKIIKELADEKEGYIKTNNLERAKLIEETDHLRNQNAELKLLLSQYLLLLRSAFLDQRHKAQALIRLNRQRYQHQQN